MDINTNYSKTNPVTAQLATANKPPQPVKAEPTKNQAGADSVSLSDQSLKLAKTASNQENSAADQIEDRNQAKNLTNKVADEIRSQPGQARNAVGNLSSNSLGLLN